MNPGACFHRPFTASSSSLLASSHITSCRPHKSAVLRLPLTHLRQKPNQPQLRSASTISPKLHNSPKNGNLPRPPAYMAEETAPKQLLELPKLSPHRELSLPLPPPPPALEPRVPVSKHLTCNKCFRTHWTIVSWPALPVA